MADLVYLLIVVAFFALADRLRARRAEALGTRVNVSYLVLGIVSVALIVYLFYALLRPEKF